MKIASGATDLSDTELAMAETLQILEGNVPDFVVVHMAAGHDATIVQSAIQGKWGPAVAIHGGTSCLGVMTGNGPSISNGEGLGIATFEDPNGDYGVGLAEIGDDARGAASAAARMALENAGRVGEAPEMIWLTAAPGAEEAIVAGIEDVVGRQSCIVGGSAADNTIAGDWFVFDKNSTTTNGLVVSMLFPSTSCATAYQSGYSPTGQSGIANKTNGRRVYEIDGRPARQVYSEWTGGTVAPNRPLEPLAILADSTFSPLGRKSESVADVPFYLLAHPSTANPDDSLDFFADIEEGEEIRLMSGEVDSLTTRAGRVAALAVEQIDGPVAGALVVYCGGCMLAVQDHMGEVAAGIDNALGGAPFLGVFTFGEQGPVLNGNNRHGNLMISCVTFST